MEEPTKATHRRTLSSHQHPGGQSPQVGAGGSSCAVAFYHMIDWNLSKRSSSTRKRIIAERSNQDALNASKDGNFTEQTSRSTASKLPLKEGTHSTAKNTPAFDSTPSPASVKSDATSKRSPGVVARLMGLESLPQSATQNSLVKSETPQDLHSIQPPPVLLQELLRLELHHSKKSFKDKLPGFTKKPVDLKSGRGDRDTSQKKEPTAYFLPHGHSRSFRPSLPVQEDVGSSLKQPFLSRLHTGAPIPQNSNTPILSPSMFRGKNTVRLLEAAVKSLEPVPRRKYSFTIGDSSRVGTPSESGGILRSEKSKAVGGSGYGRVGSPANSSTRPVRSQFVSSSRSGKDDRAVQSGHESSSPGSRSTSRARYEANRQARSVSPLQSRRSRTSNAKRMEDSPRPLLRTYEASIRGFKIDLSNPGNSPLGKKLKKNDSLPQAVELDALPENLLCTPSPKIDRTPAERDYPEPCTPDHNVDVNADVNENSPSTPVTAPEKSSSSGGFQSVRFRSRSAKQEKEVEVEGNLISPSHKPSMEKSVGPSPPEEVKVASAGFTLFSSRKQGNKKGNEKGEALVIKRTDSTWMRNFFRRPLGSTPWTSKSSKKVNVEVEAERMESVVDVALQAEPASSPARNHLKKTKEGTNNIVQTRYRSIDDVFPELPIEEKDESRPSPDLEKTIRAVEKRFLGFGSQGDADFRSIERMFGKEVSRTLLASSLASPESSPLLQSPVPETSPSSPEACGVPGTFPNSPLAKLETSLFSSRNQLNLHDMFELVSGSRSHNSPGRRRSVCFSEPRERILDGDEEAGAVSETCSNSVSGGTPEHVKNRELSGASEWSEGVVTPPALKNFEEKLANVCVTTPPALEMFEENFAQEDVATPPPLKTFEEKLEHEDMKTPPVLKKFEEKLAHEDVTTPKFEEKLAREGVMTPPALKKFEENLAQGFSDLGDGQVVCSDEFGQPSPVSVLQSPFLDEVSVTPDASLAELQLTDEHLNDTRETEPSAAECVEDEPEVTSENMATSKVSKAAMPEVIQTDMIEQVILDISRIRNIDVKSIGLVPATIIAPADPQQEENYIREVLNAANLLLRNGESAWHPALNQSLFNRLEFGRLEKGPNVRSERKLLFDSVHEVMVLEPWLKTSSFYVDLPMFPELYSNSKFRSPIFGEALVHDVHRMICHWRDIAGNCLDDLIDYDMNVPEGRWVEFGHEVADIGLEIERTLLRTMILEIVDDLTSISATRASTTS